MVSDVEFFAQLAETYREGVAVGFQAGWDMALTVIEKVDQVKNARKLKLGK